jgi:hypothetical protein
MLLAMAMPRAIVLAVLLFQGCGAALFGHRAKLENAATTQIAVLSSTVVRTVSERDALRVMDVSLDRDALRGTLVRSTICRTDELQEVQKIAPYSIIYQRESKPGVDVIGSWVGIDWMMTTLSLPVGALIGGAAGQFKDQSAAVGVAVAMALPWLVSAIIDSAAAMSAAASGGIDSRHETRLIALDPPSPCERKPLLGESVTVVSGTLRLPLETNAAGNFEVTIRSLGPSWIEPIQRDGLWIELPERRSAKPHARAALISIETSLRSPPLAPGEDRPSREDTPEHEHLAPIERARVPLSADISAQLISALQSPESGNRLFAVFPISITLRRALEGPEVESLNTLFATELEERGLRLIPPANLRHKLLKAKAESYRACFDDSCQIEAGKELAAEAIIHVSISALGDECVASARAYDLRTETSVGSISVRTPCGAKQLGDALEQVAVNLVLGMAEGGYVRGGTGNMPGA